MPPLDRQLLTALAAMGRLDSPTLRALIAKLERRLQAFKHLADIVEIMEKDHTLANLQDLDDEEAALLSLEASPPLAPSPVARPQPPSERQKPEPAVPPVSPASPVIPAPEVPPTSQTTQLDTSEDAQGAVLPPSPPFRTHRPFEHLKTGGNGQGASRPGRSLYPQPANGSSTPPMRTVRIPLPVPTPQPELPSLPEVQRQFDLSRASDSNPSATQHRSTKARAVDFLKQTQQPRTCREIATQLRVHYQTAYTVLKSNPVLFRPTADKRWELQGAQQPTQEP